MQTIRSSRREAKGFDSLSLSIMKGKDLFKSGQRKASILLKAVEESMKSMDGVTLQYVEIRDAETLEKIKNVDKPAVIAVAAIVGSVRLIDNIIIGRSE